MALTQTESNALMNDFDFRGRVKVCLLTYAQYLIGAPIPGAPNTSERWARETRLNPEQAAMQLHALVVLDPAVQANGKAITDAALQPAVEGVVKSLF